MKDEIELAAVVVDAEGRVTDGGAALLSQLDESRDLNLKLPSPPDPDAVDGMYAAALDWVTGHVAAQEQALQARNDEIVTAQVESLRLSADRRRLWLQEQIQEGRSEPILRMRRAQLRRQDGELEAKLAGPEAKRGLSVVARVSAM